MSQVRFMFGRLLLLSFLAFSVNTRAAENSCISCHQRSDYFAQYPKLHEYYQQFLASPHKLAGVTCDDCHGGNARAESVELAHVGVLPMNNKNSAVHYQKQPETCGQCHDDKRRQFLKSKHYAALMDQRAAPTCTTCHPAMSRRPELRSIVVNACRNCHGEGNSENLPLIADQAARVFNQLNIAGGLLGWTKIHYESHGWPLDSRDRVRELDERYNTIVNRVHQFDLEETEEVTVEILGELREIFREVQQAYQQQAEGS